MTAMAIAMLVQQGKLSLHDDIRKYVPQVHDFGKPITIRHLVYHTSGLIDHWELLCLGGVRLDDVITKEAVMKKWSVIDYEVAVESFLLFSH